MYACFIPVLWVVLRISQLAASRRYVQWRTRSILSAIRHVEMALVPSVSASISISRHQEIHATSEGWFTHSMPFPCHAAPLRVQNVSFPFDLHSAAVSDSRLPCHAHAMHRPCCSSGHGTARPSRDGLWATCPLSASSGYHAEFHEGCYQTHNNLRCRWPVWNQTPFARTRKRVVAAHYEKEDLLNCWTSSSDISG